MGITDAVPTPTVKPVSGVAITVSAMGSLEDAIDMEEAIMLCYCCLLPMCDCTIYTCATCDYCTRCCECDDD